MNPASQNGFIGFLPVHLTETVAFDLPARPGVI